MEYRFYSYILKIVLAMRAILDIIILRRDGFAGILGTGTTGGAQSRAADNHTAHAGRGAGKRLDGRSERDCDLRFDPVHASAPRHYDGGGHEFSGRARHDADQPQNRRNDLQHGRFRRRRAQRAGRPLRRHVRHCDLGDARMEIRHPHKRKPRADRRPFRRRNRTAGRACRHQRRNGSRSSTGSACPLCSALPWAGLR